MSSPILAGLVALPRSLDVNVTVSKPQAEQTTDLSVSVFVQAGAGATPFDFGANRVAFFSTYDALAADTRVSAEGRKAAREFFARSDRAKTLAVGQVFTTAQKGYLRTGAIGTYDALHAVATGSFSVAIDGVNANITGVDFTGAPGAPDFPALAAILQTKLRAVAAGGFTLCTVTYSASGQFVITSGTSGAASQVSVLAPVVPASGVDLSGPGMLNGRAGVGVPQPGYVPGALDTELDAILSAARVSGKFVYGWILDAAYRDSAAQTVATGWAQAHTALMPVVSNSPLAYDASSSTDLAPLVVVAGQYRAVPLYHNNPEYYPDASLLSGMLAVDYAQKNSTRTAKFMDFPGVPLVPVTEPQWTVLESKGYNTLTLTGNTSRVFREGTTGSAAWYIDDVINLDNFKEEVAAAAYNVFVRNKKITQDRKGQTKQVDALQVVCEKYVYNGTFSPREVLDLTKAAGFRIDAAYTITPSPFSQQTVADRAARIMPPIVIDGNLAGAGHSVSIAVNAYS